MARKQEWLSLWFPLGVGTFFCGASVRWPQLAAELMSIGAAIVAGSVVHRFCRLTTAVTAALVTCILVFVGFYEWDLYHPNVPTLGPHLEFAGIKALEDEGGYLPEIIVVYTMEAAVFVSSYGNSLDNADVNSVINLEKEALLKSDLRGHFGINAERVSRGVGWPGQM